MNNDLFFRCGECGKEFESGAHLGNHLKKPHPPRSVLQKLQALQNAKKTSTQRSGENLSCTYLDSSLADSKTQVRFEPTTPELGFLGHAIGVASIRDGFQKNGSKVGIFCQSGTERSEGSDLHQTNDSCQPATGDFSNGIENIGGSQSTNQVYGAEEYSDTPPSGSNHASEVLSDSCFGQEENSSFPFPLSTFTSSNPSTLSTAVNDLYERSLPQDVFLFYKYFGDVCEEFYREHIETKRNAEDLSDACKLLVNYCMKRRMSQSEMRSLFEMQVDLENCHKLSQSEDEQCFSALSNHFRDPDSFVSFVIHERKRIVKAEGWKKAIIINNLGVRQVGVFLPITRVIQKTVEEAGGLGSIRRFQIRRNEKGKRTFSCPLDSDMIRIESETERFVDSLTRKGVPKVFFSIYCDDTLLSKSGSQDAAILRIRIENIDGANLTWHDIGIPPKLEVGNGSISSARKRQAKLELFHRFLFLILEEIALVNIEKVSRRLGFEPVLLGFVTDQPQERVFLCLKRGNCQQDCSFCCFRSAEDRVLRKRNREAYPEDGVTKQSEKSDSLSVMQEKSSFLQTPKKSFEEEAEFGDCVHQVDLGCNESQGDQEIDEEAKSQKPIFAGIPIPSRIDRYVPRDVYHTVKMQLQAAVLVRMKASNTYCFRMNGVNAFDVLESQGLAYRNNMLAAQGALPLPPAFACLAGICSSPNRLYTLPTIDLLHSFDLGPSKQFCDEAFIVLRGVPYSATSIRSSLARVANQRVSDSPSDTLCHGMTPFKTMETDRQASYTGKERRLLCPILWAATMGLSVSVAPDDDPLFKAALYLDFMQAELKGINRSIETRRRTIEEITLLQDLCMEACNHFIQCFSANESTKLHRIMVHLGAHLRGYGNLRVSDTGPNETLHRGVKASYHATNKRQSEIGPQLLQVNISADMQSENSRSAAENHLLLTRDPIYRKKVQSDGMNDCQKDIVSHKKQDVIALEVSQLLRNIYGRQTAEKDPEAVIRVLLSSKDGFGRYKYSRKKRVTVSARFEWDRTESVAVRQTLYAKASTTRTQERFDSVRYAKGDSNFLGMIQGFITRLPTRREQTLAGETVVIVRVFRRVAPVAGNQLIVDKFGYHRVAYESRHGDVYLDCVPLYSVARRVVVLRDMWDVAVRYTPATRVPDIPDTAQERIAARFFIGKNIQFTSIGEELLLATNDEE